MYDIPRGLSTNDNCSHHDERRTCRVNQLAPNSGVGVLSGIPNPTDDPHVLEKCAPFFQEV